MEKSRGKQYCQAGPHGIVPPLLLLNQRRLGRCCQCWRRGFMINGLPCLQHAGFGDRKSAMCYIRWCLFPKQPVSSQKRLSCALVEWSLSAQTIDELALGDGKCRV